MKLSPNKPMVLLLAGLPGVGKTALATALAPALGGVVLNRDDIRDRIFPAEYLDYSSPQNEVATATLLRVLTYLLAHRAPPVILIDGKPFSRRAEIDAVQECVAPQGATLIVLHCVAPADVIAERLRRGLDNPINVRAERHPEKAARIRDLFEPITHTHITVDLARPIGEAVIDCIERLQSAQVRLCGLNSVGPAPA